MISNLTTCQQDAYKKFLGFLLSNEKEFHLFGSAGCGKTFLTRHFVNQGLKDYKKNCAILGIKPVDYIVDVTATTNKAVEVLQEAGFTFAETVFKLFSVKVVENFKTGETYLKEGNTPVLKKHLIIVDECSMLPQQMKKIIRANTWKCKVIYVGDNYQLAPVKEKPSWNETPTQTTAVLSTPVRNKNSQALINLCSQLRTTVDTQEFKDIHLVPGCIEKFNDAQLQAWLMKTNFSTCRVLSYTNERAIEYIKWIEQFRAGNPDFLRFNQLYINNSFYDQKNKTQTFYPEEEITITSLSKETKMVVTGWQGDEYEIEGCWATVVGYKDPTRTHEHAFIASNPLKLKNLLKVAAKRKDWVGYFSLQSEVMDLRLPYASTVHKAQGSSYDEVVVDLESFEACKSYSVASRLLYVAASRARNKVYFYGDMPKRFGSLVEV